MYSSFNLGTRIFSDLFMKISSKSFFYGFCIIEDFWQKFLSRFLSFWQCETSFISGTEDIYFWKDFLTYCKN